MERGRSQLDKNSGLNKKGPKTASELLASCSDDFTKIEKALNQHFHSHIPFVNEVAGHILFAGGKRIRPLLTVLAARLCGRNDEAVFDPAVVPEYLHAASLLHDDVIDEGEMRRGNLPAYKIWGNKAAILVGDFLYARAIELASRFGDARIARVIAETVALMSEGEIIQLLHSTGDDFDKKIYMDIIHRKTAVLISASCKIGALLANGDDLQVSALEKYGTSLGQAFQIIDDVLDYTADPEELGKALGTDLNEGKRTLPLVYALEQAGPREKDRILGILESGPTDEDLGWIQQFLKESGSIDLSMRHASEIINEARDALEVFEGSREKDLLLNLATFILKGKK